MASFQVIVFAQSFGGSLNSDRFIQSLRDNFLPEVQNYILACISIMIVYFLIKGIGGLL